MAWGALQDHAVKFDMWYVCERDQSNVSTLITYLPYVNPDKSHTNIYIEFRTALRLILMTPSTSIEPCTLTHAESVLFTMAVGQNNMFVV